MSVKRSPRSKPQRKQPLVNMVIDEIPVAPEKARQAFRLIRRRLEHKMTQKELETKIGALFGFEYVEKYGWRKPTPGA